MLGSSSKKGPLGITIISNLAVTARIFISRVDHFNVVFITEQRIKFAW